MATSAQGNVVLVGRKSPYSLYNQTLSSFEDDGGAYDQADAAGFIKLQVWRPAHSWSVTPIRRWCHRRCVSWLPHYADDLWNPQHAD